VDGPVSADEELADEAAMRLAIEEARAALAHDDVPIGALVLAAGRVVARAHNERERLADPTAHAELLVLRQAAAALGRWRLGECTLVVTIEPCAMCAGAIVLARLRRVVFGAFDPKAGACGSLYNLCADPRLNAEPELRAGVLAGECGQLVQAFFAGRRPRGAGGRPT
jgi:tRNA(adenine34) deaminase